MTRRFSKGDRVVHLDKPEWGGGLVTKTQIISKDGAQMQLLTVRFDHAGSKSLSTSHARLAVEAEYLRDEGERRLSLARLVEPNPFAGEEESSGQSESLRDRLLRLPDEACDPFLPLGKRLEETLKLYRFDGSPRALIDWGIVQLGFEDPLARLGRHELEMHFQKWQRLRDQHLESVLKKLRREDAAAHERARAALPPRAAQALRRRHSGR